MTEFASPDRSSPIKALLLGRGVEFQRCTLRETSTQPIQMSATAGADGRLLLDIPTGTAGCNFDVEVVLHSASSEKDSTVAPSPEWMRTCGAIDDETFDVRRPTDLTISSTACHTLPGFVRSVKLYTKVVEQVPTENAMWLIEQCISTLESATLERDLQFHGLC